MLGLGKSHKSWKWSVYGKHSCARDYVTIGEEDVVSQAFFRWIEAGYKGLGPEVKKRNTVYSWRFWAKTPKDEIIIVGLLKDSCDAIGRPYPLMMIGAGTLSDWQKQWHLLPWACEGTWMQMEKASSRRYADTTQFKEELALMRPPKPEWESCQRQAEMLASDSPKNDMFPHIKQNAEALSLQSEIIVPLDQQRGESISSLICLWHILMRNYTNTAPNAVFMGGEGEQVFLAVFARALGPRDFVELWASSKIKE